MKKITLLSICALISILSYGQSFKVIECNNTHCFELPIFDTCPVDSNNTRIELIQRIWTDSTYTITGNNIAYDIEFIGTKDNSIKELLCIRMVESTQHIYNNMYDIGVADWFSAITAGLKYGIDFPGISIKYSMFYDIDKHKNEIDTVSVDCYTHTFCKDYVTFYFESIDNKQEKIDIRLSDLNTLSEILNEKNLFNKKYLQTEIQNYIKKEN